LTKSFDLLVERVGGLPLQVRRDRAYHLLGKGAVEDSLSAVGDIARRAEAELGQ